MNGIKPELELKRVFGKDIKNIKYFFDMSVVNRYMICLDTHSLHDIIKLLQPEEEIYFSTNTGYSKGESKENGSGLLVYDPYYDGSIFWPSDFGECVRINSSKGSIKKWVDNITRTQSKKESSNAFDGDILSSIIEDIGRINSLDGRDIGTRFIKYNEEFGEFSAEVIKMLGSTQKPYDEEHLIEEAADSLQCLISIQLDVCKKKNINFARVLKMILEKNKKWEAKIKDYTNNKK